MRPTCSDLILENQFSYGHHFHLKRKLPIHLLSQNFSFMKIIVRHGVPRPTWALNFNLTVWPMTLTPPSEAGP